MDRLKMHTENGTDKKFDILKNLFPNAITEKIAGYEGESSDRAGY